MKKATHLTSTSVALNRRRFSIGLPLLVAGAAAPQEVVAAKAPSRDEAPIVTYYRTKTIDGIKIFYRELVRPTRRSSCCCTAFRPRLTCFAI